MKKLIYLLMSLLIISAVSAVDLKMMPTYAEAGETNELFVSVYNPSSSNLNDVRVIAYIPDLDIYKVSNKFDLDDREAATAYLFIDIPEDARKGYYPVILFVYGENLRETGHSWLAVS